jgi:glycosyltransferase involved in cell wall biosynthesis
VGAVRGVDRLRRSGRRATAVISSYTTYRVETESLVRGAVGDPWRARSSYRAQALWAGAVVERYERDAYRRATRVWVNYDAVRRIVVARHGADVRLERIGYGPESAFFPVPDPGPVPAEIRALESVEAPLVVCVARHHSRKGVDVLINALARLRDDGVVVRACLVGGGPLLAEHRRLVGALGLTGTVAVTGLVDAVEPYLQAADVVVQPSREEQSGTLAVLEALRLGRPLVASAVDGIPEDLTDGETALLVPPGDAGALASALERVIGDEALRRRLGSAAEHRFAERFAATPFTETLAAAYASIGFTPGP